MHRIQIDLVIRAEMNMPIFKKFWKEKENQEVTYLTIATKVIKLVVTVNAILYSWSLGQINIFSGQLFNGDFSYSSRLRFFSLQIIFDWKLNTLRQCRLVIQIVE